MGLVGPWSEERIDTLRDLWRSGYSASDIARTIGVSRSAVLGKVFRLELPHRKAPQPRPVKSKAEVKRDRNRFVPTRLYAKAPPRPLPPPVIIESNPRGVTLLDLKSGDCRWPMGDPRDPGFLYCGDNVRDGSSYCAAHHAIAYTPSTNRRPGKGDVRSAGGSQNETPVRVNF